MSAAIEGQDYYFNDAGLLVMTEASHLERGHCCGNRCQHCPYEYAEVANPPLPAGDLAIRLAEVSDAAGIARTSRQAFAATYGPRFTHPGRDLVPYLETTFSVAATEKGLREAGAKHWVLVDGDDRVWGVCRLRLAAGSADPDGLQLAQFHVLQAARRVGATEALLKAAELEAAARGACQIWVACLKGHCLNIAFFARQGFANIAGREQCIGAQTLQFHLMSHQLPGKN